ncbi:hypothetical protein BC831DRAFT_460127, partial [Entophlyctis helioformis]
MKKTTFQIPGERHAASPPMPPHVCLACPCPRPIASLPQPATPASCRRRQCWRGVCVRGIG